MRKESSDALSTAPVLSAAEAAETLDWQAFSARYFPERSRHDSEVRSAYAAYGQGREWRTTPARLRLVPTDTASSAVEPELDEPGTRAVRSARADQ